MEASQKKISFGFSKLKQASQLVKPVEIEKKEVEYVDTFDVEKGKFSYQGALRNNEEVKKPLVIPLVGTRSAYDVIKAKLDSRGKPDSVEENQIKQEVKPPPSEETSETPNTITDVKPTLETLAAKEILDGLKEDAGSKESGKGMVIVPDMEKPTFEGEKESTLEDYENIPVDDFGLALLRGMGWTPQTGIGKENKVVAPVTVKMRPKRLGLGAEGATLPPGERPPLKRGSLVKVIAGHHKNQVGVVEGLDGDTGSVFLKLSGNDTMSLSESIVTPITKKEYEQIVNGSAADANSKTEKKYGIVEKVKIEKDDKEESKSRSQLQYQRVESKSSTDRRNFEASKSSARQKVKEGSESETENPRSRPQRSVSKSPQREKKERRSRERSSKRKHKDSSNDRIKETKKRRSRDSSDDGDYRVKKEKHASYVKSSDEKFKRERRDKDSDDTVHKRRHRSRSGDRKSKKKSRRSSSEEEYSKKTKSRRRSSSEDESSRRKKKKKKEKRRHRSESSD